MHRGWIKTQNELLGGHLLHIRALRRSMWHHADTLSDGSQSVWKVDSTCTLQLQACPVARIQVASNHFLGSLGGHMLDCWWAKLWMYFTELHQRRTRVDCRNAAIRNHINGTTLSLLLPSPRCKGVELGVQWPYYPNDLTWSLRVAVKVDDSHICFS